MLVLVSAKLTEHRVNVEIKSSNTRLFLHIFFCLIPST